MADAAGLEGAGGLEGFEFEIDVARCCQRITGGKKRGNLPACFERKSSGSDEGGLHPWLGALLAIGTHFVSPCDQLILGNAMGNERWYMEKLGGLRRGERKQEIGYGIYENIKTTPLNGCVTLRGRVSIR